MKRSPASGLRSESGAFDLPSIITGVIAVAILAGGVLAAVFGVIPFAQDHSAKQDLGAVRTAQGVAMTGAATAGSSGYRNLAELRTTNLLTGEKGLDVSVNDKRDCYLATSRSDSGAMFYATSREPTPVAYTAGDTIPGCSAPAPEAPSAPVPDGKTGDPIHITPAKAQNGPAAPYSPTQALSGYGKIPGDAGDTVTSWGMTYTPDQQSDFYTPDDGVVNFAYYDPSTSKYVDFFKQTTAYPVSGALISQQNNSIFFSWSDYRWDTAKGEMTTAEKEGFQKFLDNGGKVQVTLAVGSAPAVLLFDPITDRSGYDNRAIWPWLMTTSIEAKRHAIPDGYWDAENNVWVDLTHYGPAYANANASMSWTIEYQNYALANFPLKNVADDNGKTLGKDTTTATWTVSDVVYRTKDASHSDPYDALHSDTVKITVDLGREEDEGAVFTVEFLGNTFTADAAPHYADMADFADHTLGNVSYAGEMAFNRGGESWTLNVKGGRHE